METNFILTESEVFIMADGEKYETMHKMNRDENK